MLVRRLVSSANCHRAKEQKSKIFYLEEKLKVVLNLFLIQRCQTKHSEDLLKYFLTGETIFLLFRKIKNQQVFLFSQNDKEVLLLFCLSLS